MSDPVDLKALQEALEDSWVIPNPQDRQHLEAIEVAARAVLEAPIIKWCITHEQQATHQYDINGPWVCFMCDQTGIMGHIALRVLVSVSEEKPQ